MGYPYNDPYRMGRTKIAFIWSFDTVRYPGIDPDLSDGKPMGRHKPPHKINQSRQTVHLGVGYVIL